MRSWTCPEALLDVPGRFHGGSGKLRSAPGKVLEAPRTLAVGETFSLLFGACNVTDPGSCGVPGSFGASGSVPECLGNSSVCPGTVLCVRGAILCVQEAVLCGHCPGPSVRTLTQDPHSSVRTLSQDLPNLPPEPEPDPVALQNLPPEPEPAPVAFWNLPPEPEPAPVTLWNRA